MKRIMLLGALYCLCLGSASAQNFIEKGDSLYDVIVTNSDVDITFVNDTLRPWNIEGIENVVRGKEGCEKTTSWLTLSFTLDEKSELSFDWATYNYSSHINGLGVYIDGVYNSSATNSSFSIKRFILDKGEHTVAFRDTIGNSSSNSNWSAIKNVQINAVVVPDYSSVVEQSDVEITFENDNWLRPWTMENNRAVVRGRECSEYTTSWLTLSFSLDDKSEILFEWASYNYSAHSNGLELYIDGIYNTKTTNSSYSIKRLILDKGEHTVAFRDTIGSSSSNSNWSAIKNLKILPIKPLETVVLTEKSKPLTFTNESEWPWLTKDGFVENTNYGFEKISSKFSTTFTVDKVSKLSFDRLVGYWNGNEFSSLYTDYHRFNFYINGDLYTSWRYALSYGNISVALEPGTYTLVWEDTIMANYPYTYYTRIKDIELSDDWLEVNVPMPGTLGIEALYLVNVLDDIELLKVTGTLNSADWASISQMNNLVAIDLSEAKTTSVPNNAFDGLARLSYCKLPEGVNSIGDYAFRGTQILNIDIPNSVISIGNGAFYQTRVRSVNFGLESQLQSIGYEAFYQCTSLKEFIMPDGVNYLNYNSNYGTYMYKDVYYNNRCSTFSGCTSLKKIHFSDALNYLGGFVCYDCTNLTEVHLPISLNYIANSAFENTSRLKKIELPESLRDIHQYAFENCGIDTLILPIKLSGMGSRTFENCSNLKYIELPSYITINSSYFYECKSIQTIVAKSATPPVVSDYDPFNYGPNKNTITLKVPSFAIVNYKLDPYWYQFGQIVAADDDIDYWKITGPLSLTNNRRMSGKPDIDLYNGGQLLVSGNAPMEIGQFTIFPNQSDPGRILNKCDAVTADSISTELSVEGKKWYFITPLHDVLLSDIELSNDAMYVFRYYDGANRALNGMGNSWKNVADTVLYAGQGYIFQSNKETTIKMPAKVECHAQVFNTSDVSKVLATYDSEIQANKNWNFVGNPYPCYYDVYYMDFTAPITVWTGSTYKAYSIVDDNFVLSPAQAFFVQKPDGLDSIVFHQEGRQLTTEVSRASYAGVRSLGQITRRLFDIKIQSDDLFDETRIVINEAASGKYEIERDASKFMSIDTNVPQICTIDEENTYAINERPLGNGLVKLAYSASVPGTMTISAVRYDGTVILHDNLNNVSANLTEQDYSFQTDATDGLNTTRFSLSFAEYNTTGVNNTVYTDGLVQIQEGGITVTSPEESEITIYNLEGKTVYEGMAGNERQFIALPSGKYLVKINAETVRILVY